MPLKPPQRLIVFEHVCDTCGGVGTFKMRTKIKGVSYAMCSRCGRSATVIKVTPKKGKV